MFSCGSIQIIECRQVALSKVHYVNVVTHTRPIGSVVIITKNIKFFELAHCDLCDKGHQVVRQSIWILANQA